MKTKRLRNHRRIHAALEDNFRGLLVSGLVALAQALGAIKALGDEGLQLEDVNPGDLLVLRGQVAELLL